MKKIQILNNQNKIYSEVTSEASYLNECHEFCIRLVLNGSEDYKLGNKQLTVYPGCFLVINEGTIYNRKISSLSPVNTLSILYTASFLNSFHHNITATEPELLADPFITPREHVPTFLESLYPLRGDMQYNLMHLTNLFNSENYDDLLMNEYLIHSLINFYRVYNKEVLEKSEQLNILNLSARKELFRRLNNAKDYMQSNYDQAISLEEICQHACLSATHLFRTFKNAFNCTPHQYLIQLRLSHAKHLLKSTNYEVREIASLVGFDSVSSFIRLFKERFGVTPGNYRLVVAA